MVRACGGEGREGGGGGGCCLCVCGSGGEERGGERERKREGLGMIRFGAFKRANEERGQQRVCVRSAAQRRSAAAGERDCERVRPPLCRRCAPPLRSFFFKKKSGGERERAREIIIIIAEKKAGKRVVGVAALKKPYFMGSCKRLSGAAPQHAAALPLPLPLPLPNPLAFGVWGWVTTPHGGESPGHHHGTTPPLVGWTGRIDWSLPRRVGQLCLCLPVWVWRPVPWAYACPCGLVPSAVIICC
jgi:hypothetical protein